MTIAFIWAWGGFALATIVCACAALGGAATTRMIAATFWVAWVVSLVVASHGAKGPGDQVILIDVLVLVVFVAVSLKARRLWTLFAAASQVDDVASHFGARLLHGGLYSYISATGIWGGYFVIGCLVAGIVTDRRDLRRGSAHARAKGALAPLSLQV